MEDSHFGADRLMAKMVEDIPDTAMALLDKCVQKKAIKRNLSYSETKEETKITYYFFPFARKESKYNIHYYSFELHAYFELTYISLSLLTVYSVTGMSQPKPSTQDVLPPRYLIYVNNKGKKNEIQ